MVARVAAGKYRRKYELWKRNPDVRDSAGQVPPSSYTKLAQRRGKLLPISSSMRESYTQGRTLVQYSHTLEMRWDPTAVTMAARDQIRYVRAADPGTVVELDIVGVIDPAEERRKIVMLLIEPQKLDPPL